MTFLLAIFVGAAGSVARRYCDIAIGTRAKGPFPYGILAVNLLGSFALGVIVGASLSGDTRLVLGTGLCGSFTTYSTFACDTVGLPSRLAAANIGANVVGGCALAWAGFAIGSAL